MHAGQTSTKPWTAAGARVAACILMRPDGGILLASIGLYLLVLLLRHLRNGDIAIRILKCAVLLATLALVAAFLDNPELTSSVSASEQRAPL